MNSKTKNLFKKIFLILMVFVVIGSSLAVPVGASDYYLTNDELYLQFMPKAYDVSNVVISLDKQRLVLNSPQDLYVDSKDNVYIADTGNNRIIMLNSKMEYVMTYPNEKSGKKGKLNNPNGVFVDKDGDLYIADTDNGYPDQKVLLEKGEDCGRIVHLAKDGSFVEQFRQPKEKTYDKKNAFKPSKVYVDDFGIIYVINSGEDFHGIITMNSRGNFLCYVATIKVKYDLVQTLVRTFGSKAQIEKYGNKTPPSYSNMSINGDGTIYATSSHEEENQIKRLTPAGANVYATENFGEENNKTEYNKMPSFVDLAVNKDGIVFAADKANSGIYIYDQLGNSIAALGGAGQKQMRFQLISSLAVTSKNEILVLDAALNTIQKITPTDFMSNIFSATTLYNNGKYEQALTPWNNVLSMASSYKLAQVGVAKSLLRQGKSNEALNLYKKSLDTKGYSEAFEQVRSDIFRAYFGWIVCGIVVLIFVLMFVVGKLKKLANKISDRRAPKNDKFGIKFFLETVVCVLFHPMDAFYRIKYNRKALRVWPILLMLGILVVEKLLFSKLIHFPLTNSTLYIDYVRDLTVFFLPLVSWIVVCFGITSISDGKQTFMETASSTLYSFVPFMIFYLPITAASNLMGTSEAGFYNSLQSIVLIWCLLLVFCNFKILNEYTFSKAIGTLLLILFAMLCLWIICFLFYIVVSQLFMFCGDLYTEFIYASK